ncbi:MAG TPA: TA system VapC family ribonuclease toxin [Terracidiphilus sp.]|nr:TA system VapC family ribonuclease toxin [Terracidiphilus sp.]
MARKYLLDLNVVVALTDDEHEHYASAHRWFDTLRGESWGTCPLSDAGYIRLATSPAARIGSGSFTSAIAVLADLARRPGYCFWPITESWAELTAPFSSRIFGHQQVTDAYLLGLAIKEDGVLATFDKGIRYMAGAEFTRNVLVLQ